MNFQRLSDRRRELGISVDDLAAAARIPKSTVSKILTGVTDNPGIETLKSIAYALGLTLEDLADDKKPVNIDGLTDREERFVWLYNMLGDGGQEVIDCWLSLSPANRRLLLGIAKVILQEQSTHPAR